MAENGPWRRDSETGLSVADAACELTARTKRPENRTTLSLLQSTRAPASVSFILHALGILVGPDQDCDDLQVASALLRGLPCPSNGRCQLARRIRMSAIAQYNVQQDDGNLRVVGLLE